MTTPLPSRPRPTAALVSLVVVDELDPPELDEESLDEVVKTSWETDPPVGEVTSHVGRVSPALRVRLGLKSPQYADVVKRRREVSWIIPHRQIAWKTHAQR